MNQTDRLVQEQTVVKMVDLLSEVEDLRAQLAHTTERLEVLNRENGIMRKYIRPESEDAQ